MAKNLSAMEEIWVQSLGWEDPLEKGMATHFSILSWRNPWAEEPGGLQSMGLQRIRGNWVTNTFRRLLLFSCYVVSDSLQPHGLQHARLLCPSLSPRVCSNSCPLNWWCQSTISSSVAPFPSCPQSFPASGSFPISLLFTIRWPEYWSFSFSISPSNKYLGLNWLVDLLTVQRTLKSSPAPQFDSINSSALSLLYGPNSLICSWLLGYSQVS